MRIPLLLFSCTILLLSQTTHGQIQPIHQQQQQPLIPVQTTTTVIDVIPLGVPVVPQQQQQHPIVHQQQPIQLGTPIVQQQQPIVQHQQQPFVQPHHKKATLEAIPLAVPAQTTQQQQQQPVQVQPIKLGTGGVVSGSNVPLQQQQQPLVQHHQPLTQPIVSSASSTLTSEQQLQQPLASSGSNVGMSMKQPTFGYGQSSAGVGLSQVTQSKLKKAKRKALIKSALLSDRVELTCVDPTSCGIDSTTSFYDAILSHTDLSIPALHLSILPFLTPFVDLMKNAPCNLTAILPASQSILTKEEWFLGKYCNGRFADSNACKTAKHLMKLDGVMVDNANSLASQGGQNVGSLQLVQMRVVQRLMKQGVQSFLDQNAQRQPSDVNYCEVADTTIFLPDPDDLKDILDYVANQRPQSQQTAEQQSEQQPWKRAQPIKSYPPQSEQDIEDICQAYLRQKLKSLGMESKWKSNQPLGLGEQKSQKFSFSSSQQDSQLLGHPITSAPTSQPVMRQPKVNLRHSRLKHRLKNEQCVTDQSQSTLRRGQITDQGDINCPQPPYQPSELPTDFAPPSESEQQQPSASEQPNQQPSAASELPQLHVRPFTISLFIQRAIQAAVSYHFLPFAAITSDMPIHLIGPTLLRDPMFVNLGGVGGGGGDINSQTNQPNITPSNSVDQQPLNTPLSSTGLFPSTLKQRPLTWTKFGHTGINQKQMSVHSNQRHAFDFGQHSSLHPFKMNSFGDEDVNQQQQLSPESSNLNTINQDSSTSSTTSSSFESHKKFGPKKIDDLVDVLIAKLFALTPQAVNTPYRPGLDSFFSSTSVQPQVVHFEKTEDGVKVIFGSPMTVWPSSATIISPDIVVNGGVIQITDQMYHTPKKATSVMRRNGLLAFRALARFSGQQIKDQIDYSSGVTFFVPQDSALTDLVQQLPQKVLARLIKAVAKFKAKKAMIKRLLERGENGTGDEEGNEMSFNQNTNIDTDEDQFEDETQTQPQNEFHTSAVGDQSQGQGVDEDVSGRQLRIARRQALLRAIQSMPPGEGNFDLLDWCRRNGIDIQPSGQIQPNQPSAGELDKEQLGALLTSHIFTGVVYSPDFEAGKSFQSVNGQSFSLDCQGESWSIGGANIIFTDLLTTNAVIHVIDKPIGSTTSDVSGGGGDDSTRMELGTSALRTSTMKKSHKLSSGQTKLKSKLVAWDLNQKTTHTKNSKLKKSKSKSMLFGSSGAKKINKKKFSSMKFGQTGSDTDSGQISVDELVNAPESIQSVRSQFNLPSDTTMKVFKLMKDQGLVQDEEYNQGGDSESGGDEDEDQDQGEEQVPTECLFHSSKKCQVVDTLQLNQAWSAQKSSSKALFHASNQPESTQCSAGSMNSSGLTKNYSRDYFSLPTFSKCYQRDVYVCSQGRLILKSSIQNQQALKQAGGSGQQSSAISSQNKQQQQQQQWNQHPVDESTTAVNWSQMKVKGF